MMVGEVTGSGHVHQTSSSCTLLEVDMVCTEPVADILTVRHDVPDVTGSPIRRSSSEAYVGGAALYYEGDISESDFGSVEDRERDTWEDWSDSAFQNGYGAVRFHQILMIRCRRLCSVAICFGMRTLPSRHECCRIVGMCLYRHCRFSLIRWYLCPPPPDMDRIVRFDNIELALMDSWIGETVGFVLRTAQVRYPEVTAHSKYCCEDDSEEAKI